jgi:hypothetical protein
MWEKLKRYILSYFISLEWFLKKISNPIFDLSVFTVINCISSQEWWNCIKTKWTLELLIIEFILVKYVGGVLLKVWSSYTSD